MQDNNTARKKVYDVLRDKPDTLTHMRILTNSWMKMRKPERKYMTY